MGIPSGDVGSKFRRCRRAGGVTGGTEDRLGDGCGGEVVVGGAECREKIESVGRPLREGMVAISARARKQYW